MVGGTGTPHAWVTRRVPVSAATSGAPSSAGSWTMRSGFHLRAMGNKSPSIAGVASRPNILGKVYAAWFLLGIATVSDRLRASTAWTPAESNPAAFVWSPAAAMWAHAGSWPTHITSCPRSTSARASGTMGKTCPTPHVELNKIRTGPIILRRRHSSPTARPPGAVSHQLQGPEPDPVVEAGCSSGVIHAITTCVLPPEVRRSTGIPDCRGPHRIDHGGHEGCASGGHCVGGGCQPCGAHQIAQLISGALSAALGDNQHLEVDHREARVDLVRALQP